MPLSDPTIVGIIALVIGVIPLSKIAVILFKRIRQRKATKNRALIQSPTTMSGTAHRPFLPDIAMDPEAQYLRNDGATTETIELRWVRHYSRTYTSTE
ncbi:hypothetical protein E8E14_005758 [Neopestalotiopsis sp. 37M]|nr:hypothetical protein E8E14_005758 [Neopestalotiopsis sp. 37M]